MIVSFTVSCARQKYLRASIESWHRARGSAGVGFAFCLEPPGTFPVEDFTAFVERSFPGRATVHKSPKLLGCLQNTRRAMETALELSADGFGVVAEEDVEVSDDVIEYLAWARDAYSADPDVVAVCAHARKSQLPDHTAVVKASWFAPLIWGTWQSRWDGFIGPSWGPLEGSGNHDSWDNNLQQLVFRHQKKVVFPVRSRAVHIGELSVQMGPLLGEHLFKASVSECYSPSYPRRGYEEFRDFWPGGFHEVPYPQGGVLYV